MILKSIYAFNMVTFGFVILKVWYYDNLIRGDPSVKIYVALLPIILLAWQLCILLGRYNEPLKDTKSSPRIRIESGDFWRIFFITLVGNWPIASSYLWGFYLYSGITVILLCIFVYALILHRRFFHHEEDYTGDYPGYLYGGIILAFLLLFWEKNNYVIHYGEPIIGHFLEKPTYDAKYRVRITEGKDLDFLSADFNSTQFLGIKGIADITVGREKELYLDGEDNYGRGIWRSYTYHRVEVNRLYFPDGEVREIHSQSSPMDFDSPAFAEDTDGNEWYVRLLDEPVR